MWLIYHNIYIITTLVYLYLTEKTYNFSFIDNTVAIDTTIPIIHYIADTIDYLSHFYRVSL